MKGTMARTWRLALTLVLAFTMLGAVGAAGTQAQARWSAIETDGVSHNGVGYSVTGTVQWDYHSGTRQTRLSTSLTIRNHSNATICVFIHLQATDSMKWELGRKSATPCIRRGGSATFNYIYFDRALLYLVLTTAHGSTAAQAYNNYLAYQSYYSTYRAGGR